MIRNRAIAQAILVAAAVVAGLYALYLIRSVLALVFISVFLAVALGPAVDFVQRPRLPRAAAILVVYLGIFLVLFGVGLLMVPPIIDGIDTFVEDVPGYVDDLRKSETIAEYDDRYDITSRLREQAEKLPERLGEATGALQSVTVGVFSALFQLVTVLVMTFFFLLDGRRMVEFCLRQLSAENQRRAWSLAEDVYRAVSGYVTGALTIALIAGTSAYLVLTILGIDLAVPLAVLMGFMVLIPLVGATIGGIIVGFVTLFDDFPTSLIVWTAFLVVYQQVENNLLQPFIYRRTVALHPLLVIVAVLIGASLLGILGALLAIPVAASVQIIVKDWWHFRKHGHAEGADHGDPPTEMGPGKPPDAGGPPPEGPQGAPGGPGKLGTGPAPA